MAGPGTNVGAAATVWNSPNYVGELFLVGANHTPFLNMIGGLSGGRQVNSWEFPVAQDWALVTASQPAITETASLTAPTAETYVRGQDVNTCQIFQKQVSVSYAKQSNVNTLAGLPLANSAQPVMNERDFQINAALTQVAVDVDYTFLQGAYQKATAANVAAKSAGILTAITTNVVANSPSAYLTKDMVKQCLRYMAATGARFSTMCAFGNAFQIQRLSDLYGYAPVDRNIGGVAVKTILTDWCELNVMWDPHMPTTVLGIFDMSLILPVFLPVPGKGVLFYEELAKVGASELGQIYGQVGLAYGPELYHGQITGLLDA